MLQPIGCAQVQQLSALNNCVLMFAVVLLVCESLRPCLLNTPPFQTAAVTFFGSIIMIEPGALLGCMQEPHVAPTRMACVTKVKSLTMDWKL